MSSIRRIQIERALEDIVRLLYSEGVKPTNKEITRTLGDYFSKNPAGLPLPVDTAKFIADGAKSDPQGYNETMLAMLVNIDTLYKASMEQVDDVMTVTTELREKIKRLKDKRRRLTAKIDDYLLSLYNTDGYYYSVSDSFSGLELVDLDLTSGYVDVTEGSTTLPIISRLSGIIKGADMDDSTPVVRIADKPVPFQTITPFSYAVDGNTNTVWSCEVDTVQQSDVVMTVDVLLGGVDLSKIEIDPYGMSESQWAVQYATLNEQGKMVWDSFGERIVSGTNKFALRQDAKAVQMLKFTIRKKLADYEKIENNKKTFRYIFGAKEIQVSYQSYDTNATFVSAPLYIATDEDTEPLVIDAVSLVVDASVPAKTDIKYYVAEDQPEAESLSDFEWKRIQPVDESSKSSGVVRFDGAVLSVRDIATEPTANDLQKIALDSTNGDPNSRNPSYNIISGTPIYRLAKFTDKPLLNSIRIDEGINTTRVYHRPLSDFAVEDLTWWADKLDSSQIDYSHIDAGNGFFYGGDIGESGRSVLVETYVDVPGEIAPVVAQLEKADPNSKTWKIRAYLNGTEVGYLDVGTDTSNLSWPFKAGLNHVVLLINIPAASAIVQNPYVGTVELFNGSNLYDYGIVKLNTWSYIDFFDLEHNQSNDAPTFTIHNGELISRRQPVGNMRVVYAKQTDKGPNGIRLRADFSRKDDASAITPSLHQYRLRFSYSGTSE